MDGGWGGGNGGGEEGDGVVGEDFSCGGVRKGGAGGVRMDEGRGLLGGGSDLADGGCRRGEVRVLLLREREEGGRNQTGVFHVPGYWTPWRKSPVSTSSA